MFVETVWIKGKLAVSQGQVLTVDTNEPYSTLQHQASQKNSFQFQQIQQVESHYRKTMIDEATTIPDR